MASPYGLPDRRASAEPARPGDDDDVCPAGPDRVVGAMRIGTSIGLIAVGLVLALAVDIQLSGIDLSLVGWILTGVGVVGLVASLLMSRRRPVAEQPVVREQPMVREQPVVREQPMVREQPVVREEYPPRRPEY
jgi:hypothetical protein